MAPEQRSQQADQALLYTLFRTQHCARAASVHGLCQTLRAMMRATVPALLLCLLTVRPAAQAPGWRDGGRE